LNRLAGNDAALSAWPEACVARALIDQKTDFSIFVDQT
jgi:hypothetical protein